MVFSKAGRDKGSLFFVTDFEGENYVYITDGNIHKVENQKYKKIKHLEATEFSNDEISEKIKNKAKITNQEIKRALKYFTK